MLRWLGGGLLLVALAACGRQFRAADDTLTAHADATSVAPRGSTSLSVSGGSRPYTLLLAGEDLRSGEGASVDSSALSYRAGERGGVTDVVRVRDAAGMEVAVPIAVGAELSISPATLELTPGGRWSFTVAGGQPPYCLRVESDGACSPAVGADSCAEPHGCSAALGDGGARASCVDGQGSYLAGTCGSATDLVVVRDANGVERRASVVLGPSLEVVASASVVLPLGTATLQVVGGRPPYAFAFAPKGNESRGAIGPTGIYVAGPNPDLDDTIQVTDSTGAAVEVTLHVGDPQVQLPPAGNYALVAGDFNADGIHDVVALSTTVGFHGLALLLGTAGSGLTLAQMTNTTDYVNGAWVGDLDGDQTDDVVVWAEPLGSVGNSLQHLRLYRGTLDGRLEPTATFALPSTGGLLGQPAIVDLRDAGGPELLATLRSPDGVPGPRALGVLSAAGDAWSFQELLPLADGSAVTLPDELYGWTGPDGAPELVGLRYLLDGSVAPAECPDVAVPALAIVPLGKVGLASDGGLLLAPRPAECFRFDALPHRAFADVGDLDHDGRLDVVVAAVGDSPATQTRIFRGLADGGFSLPLAQDSDVPAALTLARPRPLPDELDVVGNFPGFRERIVDGGLQIFGQPLPKQSSASIQGDFDGDHLSDMVVADDYGLLTEFLGSIGGELGSGRSVRLTHLGFGLASADLDHDGLPDLAILGDGLDVSYGVGAGRFALGFEALGGTPTDDVTSNASGLWLTSAVTPTSHLLSRVAPEVDGGLVSVALDEKIPFLVYGLAAGGAVDGGDVVVLELDRTDQTLTPRIGRLLEDGGIDASSVFPAITGGAVYDASLVQSTAGQIDDLAVLADDGVDGYVEIVPAVGMGWQDDYSSYLYGYELGGYPHGVQAFALQPGGVRDHLFVSAASASAGCGVPDGYVVLDARGGQLTVVSIGDLGLGCLEATPTIAAADLDLDGNTDLVIADALEMWVLWGDGTGAFLAQPLPIGNPPASVVVADFDQDGWPDIAWSRDDSPLVQVGLNHHDRSFY